MSGLFLIADDEASLLLFDVEDISGPRLSKAAARRCFCADE